MFEVSEIIYSILNGNAALMAIAKKISPLVADQKTAMPFVNYAISESASYSKEGKFPYQITISCFAETYNQSLLLAEAVKTAFGASAYQFKYESSNPNYSDEGLIYTTSNYQFKN
jgi:hypothetical protein